MPIQMSDIEYRLSGGASNTNPNNALGGAMSTVAGGIITSDVLNNLWDDVIGDEAEVGDIEYRGIYVKNNHGTLTWESAKLWFSALTNSADDEFDIALCDEGASQAMETIANEKTAPVGPTFSRPTTKATGLSIGNLTPGQYYGIWIRRTVNSGASALDNNAGTVKCEGDTAA